MRIALGMLAVAVVVVVTLLAFSAEARYRIAEGLYQAGRFETALIQCESAVRRNPRHAPARALYTELQFILGRGTATPATADNSAFFVSNLGVGQTTRPATDESPDD